MNKTDYIVEDTSLDINFEKANYGLSNEPYKTLEEKRDFWSSDLQKLSYKRIDTLDEFRDFYVNHSNLGYKPYIFRGVNEAKYKILTSLQVAYSLSHINKITYEERNELVQVELEHVRDNKCKYCKQGQLPNGLEDIDFLYISFLQHFGLYTPMLDFSYNLDKALFFAQDNMKQMPLQNDIDNYVSLYWLQPNTGRELVNLLNFYKGSLSSITNDLPNLLKGYNNVDTQILKPKNFYAWRNQMNSNDGVNKIALGYLAEGGNTQAKSIKSFSELTDWFCIIKSEIENQTLNNEELQEYITCLQNSLEHNIRLTNINIDAQEGCFLLYNPNENVPLEEYWLKNKTFQEIPILNCIDIHKDIILDCVRPLLQYKDINKSTIYPRGNDAAKQDMTLLLSFFKGDLDKNK